MKKRSQSVNVKHRKISFGDFQTETIGISVKKILIEVPFKGNTFACPIGQAILEIINSILLVNSPGSVGSSFSTFGSWHRQKSSLGSLKIKRFFGNIRRPSRKTKRELFLKENDNSSRYIIPKNFDFTLKNPICHYLPILLNNHTKPNQSPSKQYFSNYNKKQ